MTNKKKLLYVIIGVIISLILIFSGISRLEDNKILAIIIFLIPGAIGLIISIFEMIKRGKA